MIALLRYDPAWRAARLAVPLAVLFAALQGVMDGWIGGTLQAIDGDPVSTRLLIWPAFVMPPLLCLQFYATKTRYGEWELALPVTSRDLFCTRLLGKVLLVLASTLSAAIVLVLVCRFSEFRSGYWTLAANMGAAFLLGAALFQGLSPRANRLRSRDLVVVAAVTLAALAGSFWLDTPLYSAGVFALAVLVSAFAFFSLEGALSVAGEGSRQRDTTQRDVELRTSRVLDRVIRRHTIFFVPLAISLAVVVFIMAIQGLGGTPGWMGWIMPLFFTSTHATTGTLVLAKIGHLPVSRERVYRYVAWPSLAALGIGYVLMGNLQLIDSPQSNSLPVRLTARTRDTIHRDYGTYTDVTLPAGYWRVGWGKGPEEVVLASGERWRPLRHDVLPGLPLYAYNPFGIGPESSQAMAAHQLSRALEAVYGGVVPAQELEERYLTTLSRGGVYMRRDDYRPLETFPQLSPPAAQGRRAASWLLLVLAWFGASLLGMRSNVPPAADRRAVRLRVASDVLLLTTAAALFCGGLLLPLFDRQMTLVLQARTASGLSHLLPANDLLAWALVAAVAWACYRVLARRFARFEVPCGRIKNTLVRSSFERS